MMTIKVLINGRPIAEAHARNTSNLGKVSNYECSSLELAGPFTEETRLLFRVDDHMREQSCWALVEKMAREMSQHASITPTVRQGERGNG